MKPLATIGDETRRSIRGVFCDIDDTLTTEGRLTARAYSALERLQAVGLLVVPITGRPAGWCDHIARMWPVAAVVGENGAFYFRYDHAARHMRQRFVQSEQVRAEGRRKLDALGERILAEVSGCALASDQAFRQSDLAIDFCEDVPPLGNSAVDRIAELMREAGATAKISSIHVNGWFGDYDKLGMTRLLMRECFDVDLDLRRDGYVFVGDSPNDEPMFEYFPNAVGVANVMACRDRLRVEPTYVTTSPGGEGFAELADFLIGWGEPR
jgi:HAD superfamily hydrolase (TIGR01484 family)